MTRPNDGEPVVTARSSMDVVGYIWEWSNGAVNIGFAHPEKWEKDMSRVQNIHPLVRREDAIAEIGRLREALDL